MPRGGRRDPGPGKTLGRPKKDREDLRRARTIYVSDEVWDRAIEALEQTLGVGGTTNGQVLAESLRALARGEWVPTRTKKIGK